MKVIKTIRIRRENIDDIRKLECVENVIEKEGDIKVILKPEYTDGRLEAVKDEYLVKWKSGKWQRFGETAINNLYKKIQGRRLARHGRTSRFEEVLRS